MKATITKAPPTYQPEDKVTLTVTRTEAEHIRAVCRSVALSDAGAVFCADRFYHRDAQVDWLRTLSNVEQALERANVRASRGGWKGDDWNV